MTETKEVLGTQEAARELGVSVRTVQLWVEKGTLEAWKTPGGHRRILRSSVERALRGRAQPDAAPTDPDALRVLIVEDDPTMQSYYSALFDILSPGGELVMAADGYEGLVALGKTAPHLMLVDVDMPGLNGIDMLRKIGNHEIGGDVHVAVVTGLSPEQLEKRGGVPGHIPVYTKPLSIDNLATLIKDLTTTSATVEEGAS